MYTGQGDVRAWLMKSAWAIVYTPSATAAAAEGAVFLNDGTRGGQTQRGDMSWDWKLLLS